MRGRCSRESRAGRGLLLAAMLALVSLVAACGAGSESSPTPGGPTATTTPTRAASAPTSPASLPGPAQVTPTAPSTGGGTIAAVPRDGHAFSGQDRLGAPGLGAFLFFDADG